MQQLKNSNISKKRIYFTYMFKLKIPDRLHFKFKIKGPEYTMHVREPFNSGLDVYTRSIV